MSQHECPSCGQVHNEKPVSLKQRVEMLEEKVRMLEARPQWSWTNGTVSPPVTTTVYYDSTTIPAES